MRAVIEFFYSSSLCHVRHQIHDFNFYIENGGFFLNCQNGTIFNQITLFSETLILEPHTYVVYVAFFSSVLILTQVKTKGAIICF